MSEPTKDREALDEGIHTAFWALFGEHVTREWGPAGLKYQQAVRDAAKDANAVVELQKILFAQEQILLLMKWPADTLKRLQEQARPQMATASRRGPGL